MVTAGESPASPGDRDARLVAEERTGVSMCILNHARFPSLRLPYGFLDGIVAADDPLHPAWESSESLQNGSS